jgi:hypothetical protein
MDIPNGHHLPPDDNPPNDANPRRLQQVSILADRRNVINWMVEDEVFHNFNDLYRRSINTFLANFRGQKTANTMKAARWWQQREEFTNNIADRSITFSANQNRLDKTKPILTKARPGRGTKRSEWVLWLYPNLLIAFEHFKRTAVKFSAKLLCELALSVLLGPDSIFTEQSRDPKDNRLLTEKIYYNWIQQFMDVHNIVLLSQRGRLICSVEKELQIEMGTAYHLGVLQRGFQSGEFDENVMEKLDETHFVVNLDNGHTLGVRGDTSVTYAEVVSGGDSMTMVVRISGGRRSMIEAPMLIFTNAHRSCPIRGLEDTIPGVTYRTGPKGWMDQSFFPEYFNEPRAFQVNVQQRTKVVWLANCSSHSLTPRLTTVLTGKNTILRYLPPCSTHLCQPADTFIISKIKDAWTKRWEAKKIQLIQTNAWQNTTHTDGQWSGKLTNPGKRFFFQLAADSIEDVNKEVDCNNMSYARKAMICCGMALNVDGSWSVNQLFPQLQDIVAKHVQYFQGQDVPDHVRAG